MLSYIFLTLIAISLTYFSTPLVITIAKKLNLIDDPTIRPHPAHTHSSTIPRAGGLSLIIGIAIPIILSGQLNKAVVGIIIASICTVIIGLFDDYRDVSPYLRFIGNILIASVVVFAGAGIPFITNPFGGILQLDQWIIPYEFFGQRTFLVFADIFAVLWIVWTMNIIGWSSGVDGQMPGFVAITAFFLGLLSLRFSAHDISQQTVATIAFITAGAYIGFIPWNFFPQKIMPGYGGKTLAGLLIATIAIFSGGKIGSAILVLSVPMIDAGFIFLSRILRGKSPFKADRNHLHHYLLDRGWGKRRIALFYWGISFILGLLTLSLSSTQKVYAFVMIAVVICGLLSWLHVVTHFFEKEEL